MSNLKENKEKVLKELEEIIDSIDAFSDLTMHDIVRADCEEHEDKRDLWDYPYVEADSKMTIVYELLEQVKEDIEEAYSYIQK